MFAPTKCQIQIEIPITYSSIMVCRDESDFVQAFFTFFISSLVLHLGQALGLFTLVSHP